MSAILNSIISLKKDPNTTKEMAITSIKTLLTRLQSLKKKLDENYQEEEQVYGCTKKRLIELNTLNNNEKQSYTAYYKSRTNKLVVDHLLRNDYVNSARIIAEEYNLNVRHFNF